MASVFSFGALIAGASAVVLPPAGVLVCGPGSREVSLIAAKLASAAGYASTAIVADGSQFSSRLLLYGKAYAAAKADDPTRAQLAVSGDEIGAALTTAHALIVVAHEQPMEPSQVSLIVQNAPALERAVLLCRCGVTRAEAGLFGIKGPDVALRETEENWRRAADEKGFELALVRAGGLKGGGAGRVERNEVVSGEDKGLDKEWYNTLIELEGAMCDMAYDQYTLGLELRAGDPISPSPIRFAARGSFEPREDEASRILVGAALVNALRQRSVVDVTVCSAKSNEDKEMPSDAEWDAAFAAASAK